jgi:hypothetical protein
MTLLLHIYHIQGVNFSQITHLICLRGEAYCSPDHFHIKRTAKGERVKRTSPNIDVTIHNILCISY